MIPREMTKRRTRTRSRRTTTPLRTRVVERLFNAKKERCQPRTLPQTAPFLLGTAHNSKLTNHEGTHAPPPACTHKNKNRISTRASSRPKKNTSLENDAPTSCRGACSTRSTLKAGLSLCMPPRQILLLLLLRAKRSRPVGTQDQSVELGGLSLFTPLH